MCSLVKNLPAIQGTPVWFLVGEICWRRARLPNPVFLGFPCGSAGKEFTCNAGDLGLIPGMGRSPGEGKGYPLQYSGLENSMDYTVHRVTKSRIWLIDFHFTFMTCKMLVPWPGIETTPLLWKRRVFTAEPPGKSLEFLLISSSSLYKALHDLGLCYFPGFICSFFSSYHDILVLF